MLKTGIFDKYSSKEIFFCNIINVFTVTFDQFNVSLQKVWKLVFAMKYKIKQVIATLSHNSDVNTQLQVIKSELHDINSQLRKKKSQFISHNSDFFLIIVEYKLAIACYKVRIARYKQFWEKKSELRVYILQFWVYKKQLRVYIMLFWLYNSQLWV